MDRDLQQVLAPVRWRQRLQAMLTAALWGLFAAAAAGLGIGLWKFAAGAPVPLWLTGGLLVAGPALGALVGALPRRSWRGAAAAVDVRYALKDRTVTALEFLARPAASEFHLLQIRETLSRLTDVDSVQVVPLRWPRWTRWAVLTAVVAAALLAWPLTPTVVDAKFDRHDGVAEAVALIHEELQHLREQIAENATPEVEQLVQELAEKLETLEQPETDVREALATISEMQAQLADQLKQFNTGAVDAQMQALAAALSTAGAYSGAAQQLKEGDYQQAADELQTLDKVELDRKESRAASEQLEKVAAAMKQAGLSDLSDTVEQLSEGCKECNASRLAEANRRLAGQCRTQALRKSLNQLLAQKLCRLSECKSLCQGGPCKQCGGACKAGQCQKNSFDKGQFPKSDNPTKNFGMGTHGNLEGAATALDAQRKLEQITGTQGDGPSEFETTNSPEGEETARRGYREQYGKYRKLSEAVLESEPIPLGQRQLIRNYFELIRPDRDGATE